MTVSHYSIYLAFKILMKFCSSLWKVSYQQKRKYCVIVCATRSNINSGNLWGFSLQLIQCSTKPTIKYSESMHFMITRFSLLHIFWGQLTTRPH